MKLLLKDKFGFKSNVESDEWSRGLLINNVKGWILNIFEITIHINTITSDFHDYIFWKYILKFKRLREEIFIYLISTPISYIMLYKP